MTLQTFFGDIHNHNAMGFGLGSMARSIDIARSHLDFFAFTGHSSWHDMVPMEGGRERHWLDGFKRLEEGWPDVQRLIEDANDIDTEWVDAVTQIYARDLIPIAVLHGAGVMKLYIDEARAAAAEQEPDPDLDGDDQQPAGCGVSDSDSSSSSELRTTYSPQVLLPVRT